MRRRTTVLIDSRTPPAARAPRRPRTPRGLRGRRSSWTRGRTTDESARESSAGTATAAQSWSQARPGRAEARRAAAQVPSHRSRRPRGAPRAARDAAVAAHAEESTASASPRSARYPSPRASAASRPAPAPQSSSRAWAGAGVTRTRRSGLWTFCGSPAGTVQCVPSKRNGLAANDEAKQVEHLAVRLASIGRGLDGEDQPASARDVDDRSLLGELDRVAVATVDESCDPDVADTRGNGRRDHERRGERRPRPVSSTPSSPAACVASATRSTSSSERRITGLDQEPHAATPSSSGDDLLGEAVDLLVELGWSCGSRKASRSAKISMPAAASARSRAAICSGVPISAARSVRARCRSSCSGVLEADGALQHPPGTGLLACSGSRSRSDGRCSASRSSETTHVSRMIPIVPPAAESRGTRRGSAPARACRSSAAASGCARGAPHARGSASPSRRARSGRRAARPPAGSPPPSAGRAGRGEGRARRTRVAVAEAEAELDATARELLQRRDVACELRRRRAASRRASTGRAARASCAAAASASAWSSAGQ